MKKVTKQFFNDIALLFINYFVSYIPCWNIRKIFYRIFGMKIGKGARINQRVYLFAPWRISIGNNTIINSFSIIDGRGGLIIGNNTSVSMRSIIYTASHASDGKNFDYYKRKVEIGDCCWIGVSAVILPGSSLANFTIIGANTVYKGNTQENDIWVGNPAFFLRKRNLQDKYNLKNKEYFL